MEMTETPKVTSINSDLVRLSPPVRISDYFNLAIILFVLGFLVSCFFFM